MRSAIGAGLVALGSGCMPIYPGMPSQVALLHQQGDLAVGLNGGPHGGGVAGSFAVTDNIGIRLAGGYRPFDGARNGWGTGGVSGYWLKNRNPEFGVPDDGRGFRTAANLDVGGGTGQGHAEWQSFSLFSGGSSTHQRFTGSYWMVQLSGDVGYEWPSIALLGTVRFTYLNYFNAGLDGRPGSKLYIEPMVCAQFGPRPIRFELRAGVIFGPTGDAYYHEQPFILSAGVVGNFELGPKAKKSYPSGEGLPPPPPVPPPAGQVPPPPPTPPPEPPPTPPPNVPAPL